MTHSYILTHVLSASAFELQEPSSTFYSTSTRASLLARLDRLTSDVREELARQGFAGDRVIVERMLNMRFEGTDTALMVLPNASDGDGKEDFEAAFKRLYKSEFGFLLETKTITVDDVKVNIFLAILACLAYCASYRCAVLERRLILWGNRFIQR